MRYKLFSILIVFAVCFAGSAGFAQKKSGKSPAKTTQTKKTNSSAKTTNTSPVLTQTKQEKRQLTKEQKETKALRVQSQQQANAISGKIKQSMDSVNVLNNKIRIQQFNIDSLANDISRINTQINTLTKELERLKKALAEKKDKYAKSMKYLQFNHTAQDKLMFIFSADNFSQMLRRMRYVREYSAYQKAQGKIIREQQNDIQKKQNELLAAKTRLITNQVAIRRNQQALEKTKAACQVQVNYLNQNLTQVQQQIQVYQKRENELNSQIDRLIQIEIAENKRIAEQRAAERAAKRAADAAAKKAAAEKRAKAEAERKEKERQLAAARAAKEKAEAAKRAAELAREEATRRAERREAKKEIKKNNAEQKAAEEEIRKADEMVKKAETEVKAAEREEKNVNEKITAWESNANRDDALSSNFVANKGRLPMPITGSYTISGHYGVHSVAGLKNVTLDNKGIDIRGQAGAMARSVFDGVVSSVFQYGSSYIIMVRHGSYISVYSGLSSVAVSKGSKVSTRQTLGRVGTDSEGNITLHFQLRKESARLNPEGWVR